MLTLWTRIQMLSGLADNPGAEPLRLNVASKPGSTHPPGTSKQKDGTIPKMDHEGEQRGVI